MRHRLAGGGSLRPRHLLRGVPPDSAASGWPTYGLRLYGVYLPVQLARGASVSRASFSEVTLDEIDFWKWSETAKPGDSIVYYRGMLVADRANYCARHSGKSPCRCGQCWRARRAGEIGHLAWAQYERGLALLTQRKVADGDYEYLLKRIA